MEENRSTESWYSGGTHYIDSSHCIGCGACAGACPTGAIYCCGDTYAINKSSCLDCSYCISCCPVFAIHG